jgi:hypothetical protein
MVDTVLKNVAAPLPTQDYALSFSGSQNMQYMDSFFLSTEYRQLQMK